MDGRMCLCPGSWYHVIFQKERTETVDIKYQRSYISRKSYYIKLAPNVGLEFYVICNLAWMVAVPIAKTGDHITKLSFWRSYRSIGLKLSDNIKTSIILLQTSLVLPTTKQAKTNRNR